MGKINFYCGSMFAGKSTLLVQMCDSYRRQNISFMVFIPSILESTRIVARTGLNIQARVLQERENLIDIIKQNSSVNTIMFDEAQFFTAEQIEQIRFVADDLNKNILLFGLKSDFLGKIFPISAKIFSIADCMTDMSSICQCGEKATMNLKYDMQKMSVIKKGHIIDLDQQSDAQKVGYTAVCRKHFYSKKHGDLLSFSIKE